MSKVLYYTGCTSSHRTPEIASSVKRILEAAGTDYDTINEEKCCGSVLFRAGAVKDAEELARCNTKLFNELRPDAILTSCAGCFQAFSRLYRERGFEIKPKVIHITGFISQILGDGKLKLSGKKLDIVYHEPCHLGDELNDLSRRILHSIQGIKLIGTAHRDGALCCGAGGGVRANFKELSLDIGRKRIDEAVLSGADAILSSCPFCVLQLRECASGRIKVMDISEIVADAVRV